MIDFRIIFILFYHFFFHMNINSSRNELILAFHITNWKKRSHFYLFICFNIIYLLSYFFFFFNSIVLFFYFSSYVCIRSTLLGLPQKHTQTKSEKSTFASRFLSSFACHNISFCIFPFLVFFSFLFSFSSMKDNTFIIQKDRNQ